MGPLERNMFAGIVTSLRFHDDAILLAGHGPVLKAFDVQTGETIATETLLPANRIHRIVPGPSEGNSRTYAAFGSKSLRIFHVSTSPSFSIKVDRMFGFPDWIMDMQWLQDGEIALVSAHNQVEIYNITNDKPVLVDRVQCQVRCILYSARFFGNTRSDLMLASGTVFNEVHLWRISDRNEDGDGVVYRRLVGHEGVIFGVRFNPEATMISSVSDDRTIRVWSLTDEKQEPLVIYGHTARIWDCQFVDDYLVSISEDSTCRVWKNSLMGSPEEIRDREGECLACWEGHFGKNVWSCAVSPEHNIVATGGQDSGIRLWSLVSIRNNNIESEDDLSCLNAPPDRTTNLIRTFCLLDFNNVVASTDDGHLIQSENQGPWKTCYFDPELQHYSVMESSPCGSVVLAGLLNGKLLIYSPKGLFEPFKLHVHSQKIFQIFINPSKDGNMFYIVTSVYNEESVFHRLDISEPSTPKFTTLYKLEGPTERTTIIATAIDQQHEILICGSRESALLVYHLQDMHASEISRESVAPIMQLRRSHGKQAVSSVTIKPTDEKDVIIFWTTGRDGCFIEYRLSFEKKKEEKDKRKEDDESAHGIQLGIASRGDTVVRSQGWTLEKVYRNRVTKGWIEGVSWINGELLFLGFYRKRFFVYNEPKNYEMISVACGGAHRRWQFKTADSKLDRATFAFFRKEMLYAYFRNGEVEKKGFKTTILQQHYHGREVRALKYFRYKSSSSKQTALLFATGGEDTLLKLHQYMPNSKNKFVTLASIRKHRSVIKTLAWSQGNDTLLFTAGGNEELWCWKVEITDGEPVGINCLEWALCPEVSTISETRIMDVTAHAVESHPGLHFVGVAYSDSSMRIWLFNESTRKFSLLADGTWHNRCLLQISHLVLPDRILFLTSATDGRVAIWDLSQALYSSLEHVSSLEADPTSTATKFKEPIYAHKFHQSGVNAIDAWYRGDEILLVTGGEDNAVAAARFKVQPDGSLLPLGDPCVMLSAHASSVTGVKLAANSNKFAFSTSTDQRLNVWEINVNHPQGVSLTLADATFVDVPDPSVMDVVGFNHEYHAVISGIGLQSFTKTL